MRRLVGTLAAALTAATVLAVASAGAAEPSFRVVTAGNAVFPDRTYVITFPAGRPLQSEDVSVTEDGKPIKGASVQSAAASNGIGTVLLIDASNSMRGSIDEALAAARTFARRNPGQPLSVVTFNAKPRVVLRFTTNRKRINAALSTTPRLAEGTRIHDALAAAVTQIRDSGLGAGRVVLLSDGDDVGSITPKESVLSQLNAENVRVFTVGIESEAFTPEALREIANATGGTPAVVGSAADLRQIYDALGYRLANEYLVRYRSPAGPSEKVDVRIRIGDDVQTVAYTTPSVGTGGPYEKPFWDRVLQSWLLVPLVVVLVLTLLAYTVMSLWRLRSNRGLRRRLGEFVTLAEEEHALERRRQVTSLLAERNAGLRDRPWTQKLAEDLEVAEIDTSIRQLGLASLVGGLAVAVLAAAAFGPVAALAGIAVPFVVRSEIARRASTARRAFTEQLPDNLEVMGSALRAGHSLVGSMAVVVEESPEPSRREFLRVVTDEQLGVPLDEALEVTARRMRSADLQQVSIVAMIQREAGGNMAEVLDQVIANVRGRMELRRLVRVLTAQGRMAKWIISLIPVFLLVLISLINPDHLETLFHDPIGQFALVLSAVCVVLGFYVIDRIVAIEL